MIKQDVNFVDELDHVKMLSNVSANATLVSAVAPYRNNNNTNATSMAVKGFKTMFKVAKVRKNSGFDGNSVNFEGPTTLAIFDDTSPALIRNDVGKGAAYFAAFLPGVSYFAPAIPLRPVDRASVDEGFNHFIPTEFNFAARDLLTLPLAGRMRDHTVVPVTASHDLVEVGIITAPGKGTILSCVNWAGTEIPGFTVTINTPTIAFKSAMLASTGETLSATNKTSFTFHLRITADVVVLR
jgi:hypothetical protein